MFFSSINIPFYTTCAQGTLSPSPPPFWHGRSRQFSIGHCANFIFGWVAFSFVVKSACAADFVLTFSLQPRDLVVRLNSIANFLTSSSARFKISFKWSFNDLIKSWMWTGRWHFPEGIRNGVAVLKSFSCPLAFCYEFLVHPLFADSGLNVCCNKYYCISRSFLNQTSKFLFFLSIPQDILYIHML